MLFWFYSYFVADAPLSKDVGERRLGSRREKRRGRYVLGENGGEKLADILEEAAKPLGKSAEIIEITNDGIKGKHAIF